MRGTLVGTRRLVRLILRRDRVLLPVWVLAASIMPLAAASGFKALYSGPAALAAAAAGFTNNPAFRVLFGPVFASNLGSLVAWRSSIFLVVVGVFGALTVIRHTRVEEETGRRELVGSTVVGRHAPLAAALLVACLASAGLAVLVGLFLMSQGLDAVGSLAMGLQMGSVALAFAAVGALAAQLTLTAGGARAIALSAIGLTYVLRAAGDAGDVSALSWSSPIGWAQRLRPFAGEQWWVLLPLLAVVLAAGGAALFLSARRDVGGGVFASRLGPAVGSPRLASPLGLAWRLHRGLLAGWAVGLAVLGGIYGSVAQAVGNLLSDNPDLQQIFQRLVPTLGSISDLYLAAVMGVLGLLAAAYGIQATLRMRVEEEDLRAEPVLATAVPRVRWMGAHLLFSFLGPAAVLAVGGASAGLFYGVISGDVARQVPRVLAGALVQLPAVWVLVGATAALFGLMPRLSRGGWAVFGVVFFITFLGAILQFGQWFLDLSPYTHIPSLPGGQLVILPLVVLTGVAAVLAAAGLGGFQRRDLG
jgi:ABC-2 type transport system permease protein